MNPFNFMMQIVMKMEAKLESGWPLEPANL